MAVTTPGTPSLLRAINDRAALELLCTRGPLSRAQLGALTGLSKPTAAQLLARLAASGLVVQRGELAGFRGPSAALYHINPSAAFVAGLDVTAQRIRAVVCDITGAERGRFRLATPGRGGHDPVEQVRQAIAGACRDAHRDPAEIRQVVVGTPGAIDPATGRLGYAMHLPGWHLPGLVDRLRAALDTQVSVENDVNLAAMAELANGDLAPGSSFVLLWAAQGVGLAVVLDGVLHRGVSGGAGEVGYMPVPGAPLQRQVRQRNSGGYQALVGAPAVLRLMRTHGFAGRTAAEAVRRAVGHTGTRPPDGHAALTELATRFATGLAAITCVLDPASIVLTGDVLIAGGDDLRALVERELHSLTVPRPRVRLGSVGDHPVVAGALHLALAAAREAVFSSTVP